ncbi:Glycosyltransferase, catalytic subunit of cellulose synthase and poly-beta-1,6-N-acetylglucosamine synthase [Reichenbachiella faecimaris]|uniref:Glycosyltransferase, catalytic subunit of cellulose synthase and poly-beta-1,6-N-acetylglucosamine synthase n=1 Tax=Reichenbachiella faecimaris TaxID=692418 RepID=A0A1W2G7J9_REIFA|nr:glycosyltransferase [Reichenbachiella faecimaris]SMD32318.1 Glycosyltransferase, catalytic subunit of cellulose synthase and poly-beta-1,6-N-acetylglucosamine synthase [Reichenbachiella faecimaris]
MVEIVEVVATSSLAVLVIYWIVVLAKILGFKPKTNRVHPVSVIVCAHNELDNLKKLIPRLLNQDHLDFEVVIVDDRSEDGTYDYLLENQSDKLKFARVDQVHDHINAKKFALTMGIKAATHDIILLTDADCIPASEHWISKMTGAFTKDTQYVLGISPYEKDSGLLGQFIQFETQWTAMNYIGFALAGNPYMGVGRNLAYRKSSFLKHKGFSKIQHVTGGDDDLLVNEYAHKKNTRVVLGASSLTYSIPKATWGAYIHQKLRHWSVGKYYGFKDKMLLGFQNLSNLVFWLALIILAVQTNNYLIPAGLLVFRMIFVTILINSTSKKFGYRMNIWLVPVMDILYVGYASIFGIIALFTKKVRWKK